MALFILFAVRPVGAAPGFTEECTQALSKERVDELIARMHRAHDTGECALARLDTQGPRTEIVWTSPTAEHLVLLAPLECLIEPSQRGRALAFHASPEFARDCPAALAQLQGFVGEPHAAELRAVPAAAPRPPLVDPRWIAGVAWIALLACALVIAWQRRRASPSEPEARSTAHAWWWLAIAGLVLALIARFAVESTITNWYGMFLPATGWSETRFGAGAATLQAGVRAILPWSSTTAFALQRLTGALMAPLVVLLVRNLGGSLVHAGIAAILVALAPIPVRMAASSSEHVLAGTLALLAWAAWARTATDPSWALRLLALIAITLAASTRVDCLPQLAALPFWTVFGRPLDPRLTALPLRRRLLDASLYTVAWGAIAAYSWFEISVPSNHPPPELAGVRYTAKVLVSQFAVAVGEPPGWLTPTSVGLAAVGVLACVWTRRGWLLIPIAATLTLIFVPLGRNLTHDGLTGARYFVLLLPFLALLAGLAASPFEARLEVLTPSRRHVVLGGAGLVLVILELSAAWRAYSHEYTFQAEYRVLAAALAEQPLDDCTLWYVRPQQATQELDLDCCLAPDRSPLPLVAPGLEFAPMPHEREPEETASCNLYYLGSVCSVDPSLTDRAPEGLARIADQCDRLRRRAHGQALVDVEITDASLEPRFRAPPRIELWLARD